MTNGLQVGYNYISF